MYFPVPQNKKMFNTRLDRIRSDYHRMIDSAKTYITYIEGKNKGQSPMGQLRLELTKEILAQSEKELTLFEMPSKTLYAQAKGESNWDEFLYNARAERVVEGDPSITKVGAGTSTIYRKEENDGSTKYIKEEEQIAQNDLIDRTGKVSIPYLPRDFYDKIMAYTPEMAAYDQMDVRSQTEIEALGERMIQTQHQLQDMVTQG